METKITIDKIPAKLKTYETAQGWRCEVVAMRSWARGASVLGRGEDAASAKADWFRRAKDDQHEVAEVQ